MSFYVEFNPPRLNIDTGTQIARGGGSGGEISESLKEALLQMAEKVAYIDTNGQDYYQDLYNALYPIIPDYTISNVLTNVVNSNTSATISSGESYTATLSCAQNYEITSVTITMGGNDVTGTSYSSGTISIPNVTGNIVITAVATQRTTTLSSISAVFTQGANVIYDTDSLDMLKQYLVVTAMWSDSTTSTVSSSEYTLSGTLVEGTSTITVSYSGETDTFTVTVTSGRRFPTGYTQRSYVQSDRTAYIDTGLQEKTSTTFIDAYWGIFEVYRAESGNIELFGYQGTSSGSNVAQARFLAVLATDNNFEYYAYSSGASSTIPGWTTSGTNELSVSMPSNSEYPVFTLNGTTTAGNKKHTSSVYSNALTIYLMQEHKADKTYAADGSYIRCYGFKMWQNGILIRDYVPCTRDSDSEAGFYDFVTETFSPSIGASTFTYG